jgi:hypothetical protein
MTRDLRKQFAAITIACVTASSAASAVGSGLPFVFNEAPINGAAPRLVLANSMDFTYHSCVDFTQNLRFQESGYFWVSSFQDLDSVVDSQINYSLTYNGSPNGYRIYGIYTYQAQQAGAAQPTPSGGTRRNYEAATGPMGQPSIRLFLDDQQDTVLNLQNCQGGVAAGGADDILIGFSAALAAGEKSETNTLANGDLELVFGPGWVFTAFGHLLFGNANFQFFDFNANITDLNGGALNVDHSAEGSGNLFWANVQPDI